MVVRLWFLRGDSSSEECGFVSKRTKGAICQRFATVADCVGIVVGRCAYQKPHTHGLRDRSRGPGPASDRQPKQGRRALSGSRRSVGVLRTFLRPPRQRARSSGAGHPWLRSGRLSMVAVVEAAHVRPRDDLARVSRLNGPAHGRILAQRQMRAPVLVVVDVRPQYPLE